MRERAHGDAIDSVAATLATLPAVTPPEASIRTWSPPRSRMAFTSRRSSRAPWLSRRRRERRQGHRRLRRSSCTSTLIGRADESSARRASPHRTPPRRRLVVLHEDAVPKAEAVIRAGRRCNGVLLKNAEAGQRLSRVGQVYARVSRAKERTIVAIPGQVTDHVERRRSADEIARAGPYAARYDIAG